MGSADTSGVAAGPEPLAGVAADDVEGTSAPPSTG